MTGQPRRIAVLAGNYREYRHWCGLAQLSPRGPEAFWIGGAISLRGRSDLDIVTTGTWYERDDLAEIEAALAAAVFRGCRRV